MADTRMSLDLQLDLLAPSQQTNNDFDSMAVVGDDVFGVNEDGIYLLNDGTEDFSSTDIDAYFITPSINFGSRFDKRIRKVYINGRFNGSYKLTITNDNNKNFVYPFESFKSNEHTIKIPIGKNTTGVYFIFKVENDSGESFEINSMSALVNDRQTRQRG